jgi:hypothetical protein
MDQETIGKVADATKALAETGGKAIEASRSFGRVIKGPIEDLVGMVQDRVRFARWERQLALADKARAIMKARGLARPTRELPLNFAVPLLTAAVLEEDDELQETWARLLVNAGDTATAIELRTAYVEILKGMSAFDVKNLATMAKATLAIPPGKPRAVLTVDLPALSEGFLGHFTKEPRISRELGISLANLSSLGCAMPAGGLDGAVLYTVMTVTDLGLALYQACS